jgi:glycosyltransferase involved in cell wall biosynthesis
MIRWVCAHLSAREHYAVPRALHAAGRLSLMVTDAWVKPSSPWTLMPGVLATRLSERYHADLAAARVQEFTSALLFREATARLRRLHGWRLAMDRNEWFQRRAADVVSAAPADGPVVVFAHSYAARGVFEVAKRRGFKTVLGQIDAGITHFDLVRKLQAERPEYGMPAEQPPREYFQSWRLECELADAIVVNSEWSRDALISAGIPARKLSIVPLSYEQDAATRAPRAYPQGFDRARPLRLLFVGSVTVQKGIAQLLEAMEQLGDLPVALSVVGEIGIQIPPRFRAHPAIEWVGAVPRGEIGGHYARADVLVFPSHSDGFGMAQIEAQGWRLPIIASRHCGAVVQDRRNGLLLSEVTAKAIADGIRRIVAEPHLLDAWSRNSTGAGAGLPALGSALLGLPL